MTELENAKSVLNDFKEWQSKGAPWLAGFHFANNPGLAEHIQGALEEFVRIRTVAENAKPAKRISLTEA